MKNKKNIILLGCFVFLILLSNLFFNFGNDYYWHVKIGEYILTNFKIPFTDVFSWYGTLNNLHWISHEWLFEVLIYIFKFIFKDFGPIIYTSVILLLIGITIFIPNYKEYKKFPFYTIIFGVLGMIIFANKVLPRPHLISYLLFTITVYLAYDLYKNQSSKKIYLSFLISILWANFHGGSSNLSYIIYGIFLGISILSFLPIKIKYLDIKKIKKQQIIKYIIAIILSILGIIINPHNVTMLIYPYLNMTYDKMIFCIDEWRSLNILSIDGFVYLIFILLMIYQFIKQIKNKKKISLIDFSLFIIFTVLGIKSTKFMPYLYIVICYFIFNYFNKCKVKVNYLVILMFFIGFNFIPFINFKEDKVLSKEIIDYLKEDEYKLYNSYDLGGYLIYNDIKPFIDGRADMYIDSIFSDTCDIDMGYDVKLIDNYDFSHYLVLNDSLVYKYLMEKEDVKLILEDTDYSLLKKIN